MSSTALLYERPSAQSPLEEAFVDLFGEDHSFWRAFVWKFGHSNPAEPVITFNWRFSLPTGGLSTDPEHEVLLESFRVVIWGMLTNDAYGKPLSVGTLPSMSGGLREAFRWFLWKGVQNFSQLTPKLLQAYLDALPQLIVDKEEVYPGFVAEGYTFGYHSPSLRDAAAKDLGVVDWEGEVGLEDAFSEEAVSADVTDDADAYEEGSIELQDPQAEDDGMSYSQVANRVSMLYYIFAQRSRLQSHGLPALLHVPFKGKTASQVSSGITPHVINRIPALPQSVSQPLLNEVFRWVDNVGPKVASVHKAYQLARKDGDQALRSVFSELDEAGFGEGSLAVLPWRERPDENGARAADHLSYPHHRMRLATLLYRDACDLAVQYLAGMRISEICSAKVTRDKVNGLPSCLYKEVSPDGLMDLYFLRAKLVKGRQRPKAKDWVIGCIPCGSDQLPVLVRALNHLHDVVVPFFKDEKEERALFFHYSNRWGMPAGPESVGQASGTDLQRGSRRFIRCFVDLSGLSDHDNFGNDLVRYRDSKGACIRTHQGRKTFADYCLKTRKSALSALSFHYGHIAESVTYKGYYEPIQRLADEVESMAFSATIDFFVSQSQGRAVFGNMAEPVNRFLEDNKISSIEDIQLRRAKVKHIVLAHDIRIFFNDFGNCMISVNPLGSRCQEAAGGASWLLRRPNYTTRNITMCGGCDCFFLDESHKPFWEARSPAWREAAQDPTNRVAVSRHKQSVIVLRRFEDAALADEA